MSNSVGTWRRYFTGKYRRAMLFYPANRIRFMLQGVTWPEKPIICGPVGIRQSKGAEISIGKNVIISNRIVDNRAGICHPTQLVASRPGAKLTIGNNVGISGAVVFCSESITIGEYCLLGANCAIYDTDFHPLNYLDRRENADVVPRAPVCIEDDVWLGANAIVLKGVNVGARSIIAANSVVTRDVPPDSIAAGVPARVVGKAPNRNTSVMRTEKQ